MQCKTTTENGIKKTETIPPKGFVIVDEYHPCSTVTPWDYYGNKHITEMKLVLEHAGIKSVACNVHEENMHPHGSGPGGRVRFGDAMMPGIYRTAVRKENVEAAKKAIEEHKKQAERWLKGGPLPDV